ncbi:SRPBCC domain-containing protein [bacterium]|nr:SRPBCC domain-containing protein [bacterium]
MGIPEIRRHIIVKASPVKAFEAWTEPEHLSRWFCDKVTGWPGQGGTLTLTWEKFGFSMEYILRDLEPPRRVVLKSLIPGMGMQTLTVTIRPYGNGCRIEVVETGPGAEGQEGAGDAKSGWEMSLALLKTYLENYWGKNRRGFFTIITAPYNYAQLMHYYRVPEGMNKWLTKPGSTGIGEVGSDVKLRFKNNMVLTGKVMAVTNHELLVTWKEINGFLELKSFMANADQKTILARGSTYGNGLSLPKLKALRKYIEQAMGELHLILKAEKDNPIIQEKVVNKEEEEDLELFEGEADFDDSALFADDDEEVMATAADAALIAHARTVARTTEIVQARGGVKESDYVDTSGGKDFDDSELIAKDDDEEIVEEAAPSSPASDAAKA